MTQEIIFRMELIFNTKKNQYLIIKNICSTLV